MRQNMLASEALFARFGADMTLAPPQIMATECLALLRTPLLAEFLDLVRAKDNPWAHALAERLRALVGERRLCSGASRSTRTKRRASTTRSREAGVRWSSATSAEIRTPATARRLASPCCWCAARDDRTAG